LALCELVPEEIDAAGSPSDSIGRTC
jgi:hypothetical protein